jgi:2-succinyl-6-hydroxy-2,4-cyclohexadiene-1-carboxylate synthase
VGAVASREPDQLPCTIAGQGSRVVLVHGFTQTKGCWGPFLDALSDAYEVVAVDAPGHGDAVGAALDLAEGTGRVGATGGRASYIGYSMGGRYALRLALDRPDLVDALVLIGASPGIADPEERAARRRADEQLAARIEAIGMEAFVDEWLRLPLFATLPPERAFREERLRNTAAGLASSLRHAGTGAQEPLWGRLGALDVPTLLVAGAHDDKFTGIARAMAERIPTATVAIISGAGHSAHLEEPEATEAVVRSWLRSVVAGA